MKLKKNIIKSALIGLLGACTFSSCSDFLEIEPLELIVLDKFWNEEADVENVVAGCYSAMQSQNVIDRMMAWGEFRSDNVVGGTNVENQKDLYNIFKENINASNSFTTWVDFYNIINRCNTVLHFAPSVAEKDPNYTESELRATKAEVSALRDLMYFYLIRTFRDVPYTTVAYLDDNQTMDLPATKFEDVLDSLILDLESVQNDAVKKYPVTKEYYQRGRITQDAIQFIGSNILVAFNSYFYAADDVQGSVHTHITGNQYFLKVIEYIIVNLGFTSNSTRKFSKETLLCLLQAFIQGLYLLFLCFL